MSNISTQDYCVFNIFSKVRKADNIKYTIPTASPVKSLLFKYFFWEIVPYSSQDITYTTIVASVISFLLPLLPDVTTVFEACNTHEWRAGHLSFVWWEPWFWKDKNLSWKQNLISFPLSLAPFLVIYSF